MDYEKEYKKLKAGISNAYLYAQTDSTKAVLENILPELVESEDEKMYARVTERYTRFEKYYFRALGETEANKVLKQCEEEELWIKNLLEKQKDLDKMIVVSPEVWDKAISDAFENGRKEGEKQKEQKSNILQNAFDKSKKGYTLEEKSKASDYAESILPTSIIYGESEEEYKLHTIIEAAFIAGQKEQKPEWSEEDEKMIESICRSINEESIAEELKCHGKSYSINELSKLQIKMTNFLKSINQKLNSSSWKPGKEQMKAIEHAYNSFPNDCPTKSNLKLLYSDLKKLM